MRFRSYDSLKIFDTVARSLSMTKAADEVHQSKGSISYQVGKLEADLGFRLFERCLLYTSPSPRDRQKSRMPSSA